MNLSFQHLGERAFFRSIPPVVGDESLDPPPIQALASRPSRLVFEVPDGEAVGYSVAGILAAMSRLPLRVAPLAIAPRTPGTNAEWRVTVEEWELLPADFELGGTGGWQPRIVYADHLPI